MLGKTNKFPIFKHILLAIMAFVLFLSNGCCSSCSKSKNTQKHTNVAATYDFEEKEEKETIYKSKEKKYSPYMPSHTLIRDTAEDKRRESKEMKSQGIIIKDDD